MYSRWICSRLESHFWQCPIDRVLRVYAHSPSGRSGTRYSREVAVGVVLRFGGVRPVQPSTTSLGLALNPFETIC